MKIRFWKGDHGGCGFYRCELPAEALRARGWDADADQIWRPDWSDDLDVIVGQRVAMPGPSKLWARRTDLFRIFELDDDLWRLTPGHPAGFLYGDPDVRELIRMNIKVADRVIVSTDYLAERIVEETGHQDVRTLPNRIPERVIGRSEVPDVFTIGWSGSPTHHFDWPVAVHGVRRFRQRNPDTRLHLIGDVPPGLRNSIDQYTRWVKSPEEHFEHLKFDVGLAPLQAHEFNSSKSHVKALEYAARGIPIIASNAGPYPGFVVNGVTGLLVSQDHQWEKSIRYLYTHPDERDQMRMAALSQAWDYTIEGHFDEYEEMYRS